MSHEPFDHDDELDRAAADCRPAPGAQRAGSESPSRSASAKPAAAAEAESPAGDGFAPEPGDAEETLDLDLDPVRAAAEEEHSVDDSDEFAVECAQEGAMDPGGEREPDDSPSRSTTLPDLSGARILVIEDETPVSNFVSELFTQAGALVMQATDGARGLELFESERPDFVLCDLLLPKRNGFQLLDEMADSSPDTPVVIMSGVYRSEKYKDELPHAQAFLDKPIGLDSLIDVAHFLARHLAQRTGTAAPATRDGARSRARRPGREPWIPTRLLPLALMLHLLWRDRRTGLLTHRNGDHRTVFMLKEGQVHFVRCNDPDLGLGRVLVELGKVRVEELDRARSELEERVVPTRLGEVLVEMGVLLPSDLRSAVQWQLRKIIAGAFGQTAGETLFHPESVDSDEDIVIDTDTRAVIVAGCAAFRGEAEELLGHLPDGDCLVALGCDPADPALKLPPAERRLLEAVEGPTRLADVMAMAQLMGLRPRPLVFGLLCAEVLSVVESGREWEHHSPVTVGEERSLSRELLPALLALQLEEEEATGTLTVEDSSVRSWLAFDEGRLCGAGSDDARSRLGERLLSSGLIDDRQLHVALEVKAKCPRKPLGRILVEMGGLQPAQLLTAVRAQLLGIATDLLGRGSWSEARFEEGRLPDSEPLELGLSTSDVVLEGLRRLEPARLERLAGRLAQGRPELDLGALASGRFSLTDAEESVVGALASDVESLLRSLTNADESDPEVLRMLVAGLLVSPVTEPVEAT